MIVFPERLNTTKAVKKLVEGDGVVKNVRALELCAALLNDIPRAVEIAGRIIAAEGSKAVDTDFVQNLIKSPREA